MTLWNPVDDHIDVMEVFFQSPYSEWTVQDLVWSDQMYNDKQQVSSWRLFCSESFYRLTAAFPVAADFIFCVLGGPEVISSRRINKKALMCRYSERKSC